MNKEDLKALFEITCRVLFGVFLLFLLSTGIVLLGNVFPVLTMVIFLGPVVVAAAIGGLFCVRDLYRMYQTKRAQRRVPKDW